MLDRDQLLDIAINRYFGALDNHDLDLVMGSLSQNCVMWFPAATYRYSGEAALRVHLQDFFDNFAVIDFHDFVNVVDEQAQSVVCYFTVRLVDHEGIEMVMKNCNIFHCDDSGVFKEIIIYNSKALDKGFQAGNS